jgi:hypothetical protein
MRSSGAGNALEVSTDELLGFMAADANHEPSRGRRSRLDRAFAASGRAQEMGIGKRVPLDGRYSSIEHGARSEFEEHYGQMEHRGDGPVGT